METNALLVIGACVGAYFCVCGLASRVSEWLRRRRAGSLTALGEDDGSDAGHGFVATMSGGTSRGEDLKPRDGIAAWFLRNGVPGLRPFARLLCSERGLPLLRRWSSKAVGAFSKRGYAATPESVLSLVIAIALVAGVLAALVCANAAGGLAVAICCIGAFVVWVNTQHDQSADELRESVPDVLRSFESCFQAGQSLVQTFDLQAASTQGPLKEAFTEAAQVLHTGGSTTRALECLHKVNQIPEMAFVAVALDVQHQTGGSMQQVLAATRSVVEGEIDLARSMRVQTAQARLSARVVSLMPVALIAVFSLISENFLGAFFESLTGLALLGTAIAMQLAGILLVRRMLEVAR